jgi:hypothetical protein
MDKIIDLELINYIKTKIQPTDPEDNRSRFIFRELIQNADDKKARILVLRFEPDALYAANDGRDFTTGYDGDFERISRILGRHQAEDKEAVGHFGSGFQTVYALTNSPEVHSSGHSGRMNPCNKEWDYNYSGLFMKRNSPYLNSPQKGVLFRFPWRDDRAAQETIRGRKYFEDIDYWPRWHEKEQLELFNDLKKYLRHVILCCRYLKIIRLIWHESQSKSEVLVGFQVLRDYRLQRDDTKNITNSWYKGSIKQGEIEPSCWKEDSWNESFQIDGWLWKSPVLSFEYLIGEGIVKENNRGVYLAKRPDGLAVTQNPDPRDKQLKRNDIFVLIPLFQPKNLDHSDDGNAFLYSVIPLPSHGKNKFIFSAHFQPGETRQDVDVVGQNNAYGIWYQQIMTNLVQLYEWLFGIFIQKVQSENDNRTAQELILNAVPGVELSEWMRPGKENRLDWISKSKELFDSLISRILERPILSINGKWVKPVNAYWANNDLEKEVFEIMGQDVFSPAFESHENFISSLSKKLEGRKIKPETFNSKWTDFVSLNKNAIGALCYGQKLWNGRILDETAIKTLIQFCLFESRTVENQSKTVVPGQDGTLRSIRDYPVLPESLNFLYEILPDSAPIHKDFKTIEIIGKHVELVAISNGDQIINMLDRLVVSKMPNFDLSEKQHEAFSATLKTLVESDDWAPTESLKNARFIPYRKEGKVFVGTLNVKETYPAREWISSQDHIERQYEQTSIFGVNSFSIPGLTHELEQKIKFLDLKNCDEKNLSKIEKALHLIRLMAIKDNPSNLVRLFFSSQNGSLFDNSRLMKFTGLDKKEDLDRQKKEFLKALKLYFEKEVVGEKFLTKEDMGKVPCLYNEASEWLPGEKFLLHLKPELSAMKFQALNPDFKDWSDNTLIALGVAESVDCAHVKNTIRQLSVEKGKHRKDLQEIVSWLLTSDIKIDTSFANDPGISSEPWVPTADGDYAIPESVLVPTAENKKTLGENFDGFLDLSIASTVIEDKEMDKAVFRGHTESLGFRVEPSLEDLLSVLDKVSSMDLNPPPLLFDKIDGAIKAKPEDERVGIWDRPYGYFIDGKWISSRRIRIMDKSNVPVELRTSFRIIAPCSPHVTYLKADGALDRLRAVDILKPISEKKVLSSLELWDRLREMPDVDKEEMELKDREAYGNQAIYPIDNVLVAPSKIVMIENEMEAEYLSAGSIGGGYVVVGPDLFRRHGSILELLGARSVSELHQSDILEIIEDLKDSKIALDDQIVSKILRMLKRVVELSQVIHMSVMRDEPLWPATFAGEFVWASPSKCYIRDTMFVPKEFENILKFACLKIGESSDDTLKAFAKGLGAKSLSDILNNEDGGVSCVGSLGRNENAEFYGALKDALGKFFHFDKRQTCFDWLLSAKTEECAEIYITYQIKDVVANMEKAALIYRSEGEWIIAVANTQSSNRRFKEMPEEIADVCIKQGFPDNKAAIESLQNMLYRLLTTQIADWSYHVQDYEPKTVHLTVRNPFLPPELSISPNGEFTSEWLQGVSQETAQPGYTETKTQLDSWYNCCQICGCKTPADEKGYATLETLKRIVGQKDSRYFGFPKSYSTDNSLLLCPTHHVLWVRKLVRIPDYENPDADLKEKIVEELEKIDKMNTDGNSTDDPIPVTCEVFEMKTDKKTGRVEKSWARKSIEFNQEHYQGFLKTMREYLEEKGI